MTGNFQYFESLYLSAPQAIFFSVYNWFTSVSMLDLMISETKILKRLVSDSDERGENEPSPPLKDFLVLRNEWVIWLLNLHGSDLNFQKSIGFMGVIALYHLPKLWLTNDQCGNRTKLSNRVLVSTILLTVLLMKHSKLTCKRQQTITSLNL